MFQLFTGPLTRHEKIVLFHHISLLQVVLLMFAALQLEKSQLCGIEKPRYSSELEATSAINVERSRMKSR